MTAPVPQLGTDLAVQVILYDTPPPFGATNQLATGSVATTVPLTEGASIVIPLVLSGVVSSVQAALVTPIPPTGGTGSFILEGLDADGNIILASDGAAGPNDDAATFNLTVPPSISTATLADDTTTTAGSGAAILSNAKLGDTITVAQSGTPAFVGVPLDAVIEDGATPADLGPVYVPVAPSGTTPVDVTPTPLPSEPRIAGATFASSFNNGPTANGFIAGYNTSGYGTPAEIAYYQVSGGTSPTASQNGSFDLNPDNGYYASTVLDIVAAGNANFTGGSTTASIYFDVTSQFNGNQLWQLPLNSSNNGGSFIAPGSALSSMSYEGVSAFNSSADAGGYVGTSIVTTGNVAGANIAPESSGVPNQNILAAGSASPIGVAATINGTSVIGENPEFVLLEGSSLYVFTATSSTPALTVSIPSQGGAPVSLVAFGPNVAVLTNGGEIYTCLLNNAGAACTYNATAISSVSTDRHAMALGPDGALWIATGGGIIRYDLMTHILTPYGSQNYDQIVASADGRLYATVAGSGEVDAIP